jgi:hypothetical protein
MATLVIPRNLQKVEYNDRTARMGSCSSCSRPAPRHPDHQGPVTLPQTQTLWWSSQDNVELMTQKEVLNFKPAPRLEQIGDKCSKQVDDRKHRIG